MRILIIGGTRFMGPLVVRKLVASGHYVTIFHRGITAANLPEGVREILGDRNNLKDFSREFEKIKPDVVLDMILLTESQARDLAETMSDISGRLVVASSCDVYRNYGLLRGTESGPVSDVRLTEESPLREKFYPYRKEIADNNILRDYDKILVEQTIRSNANLPATVLRLPMVYGPGDYQHRFYAYIKRMIDNRPAILIEENRARWRITQGYVENCADAICLAITNTKATGGTYNIGELRALPEKEWLERIAGILGWSGKIMCLSGDKLPEHLKENLNWNCHLDVDTSRIRNELGFREKINPVEALKRTVEWERNNPPEMTDINSEYRAEDKAYGKVC